MITLETTIADNLRQVRARIADAAIKAGRAPYRVRDAEVLPGDHILMFERISER